MHLSVIVWCGANLSRLQSYRREITLGIICYLPFSGIPFAKFQRFAEVIGLKVMDDNIFYRLRRHYVTPVIRQDWEDERKQYLNRGTLN